MRRYTFSFTASNVNIDKNEVEDGKKAEQEHRRCIRSCVAHKIKYNKMFDIIFILNMIKRILTHLIWVEGI